MLYNVSYDGTQIVPIKSNRQRLFDGTAPEDCRSLSVADRESHWVFEPIVLNKNTHDETTEYQTMSRSFNSELNQLEELWTTYSYPQETLDKRLASAKKRKALHIKSSAKERREAMLGEDVDLIELAFSVLDILNQKIKGNPLNAKKQGLNDMLEALQPKRDELSAAVDLALSEVDSKTTIAEVEAYEAVFPAWSNPEEVS